MYRTMPYFTGLVEVTRPPGEGHRGGPTPKHPIKELKRRELRRRTLAPDQYGQSSFYSHQRLLAEYLVPLMKGKVKATPVELNS